MVLVPDLGIKASSTRSGRSRTLSFICTTLEADTRALFPYDPRSIARRAEEFLRASGVADESHWGPEFEFYVFDGVSYENGMNVAPYRVQSSEGLELARLGSGYTIPKHLRRVVPFVRAGQA